MNYSYTLTSGVGM